MLNTCVFSVKEKQLKSVKYLEQVRAKLKKQTDQELADALNISKGAVSHYSTGRRVMDDETCLAVAMALDINPLEIIGAACIDRAEKTGQKSLWEVFMTRAVATTASVALTVIVGAVGLIKPTNANATNTGGSNPTLSAKNKY